MVDFTDRRYERPDFADGRGPAYLTTAGDEQHAAWEQMGADPKGKQAVHGYYRGQKDTQTWQEANRLAAKRAGREKGHPDAASYSASYEDHLARVLTTKGPTLAKQFGEIKPGR